MRNIEVENKEQGNTGNHIFTNDIQQLHTESKKKRLLVGKLEMGPK